MVPTREQGAAVPETKRPEPGDPSPSASDEIGHLRDELARQRKTLDLLERDRDLLTEEVELEDELYAAVVRQMPAGLVVVDALTGQFILRNDQAVRLWGHDPSGPGVQRFDELHGRRADGTRVTADEWPLARTIRTGESIDGEEVWITRVDGSEALLEISATPVRDAAGRITAGVALLLDVTLRKLAEERLERIETELRAAVTERDMLVREMRHQIGNNLQVVSSLLGFQARSVRNDETRLLLRESQSRILAMARAHDQIHHAPDVIRIDLDRYVRQVVDGVCELYQSHADRTVVVVEVAPVRLGFDAVVKCGLVVNELASNALKHAFPDGRAGRVSIVLREAAPGMVELEVADDGVGLPEAVDPATVQTVGLPLAGHLASELGGSLSVERSMPSGTTARVRFPVGDASVEDAS